MRITVLDLADFAITLFSDVSCDLLSAPSALQEASAGHACFCLQVAIRMVYQKHVGPRDYSEHESPEKSGGNDTSFLIHPP
jgi:hypothetical protein